LDVFLFDMIFIWYENIEYFVIYIRAIFNIFLYGKNGFAEKFKILAGYRLNK